jgi:hypothetical protein
MTYTYAYLDVSPACYAEVHRLLSAAGYHHAFDKSEGHEVIDMHGIALRVKQPEVSERQILAIKSDEETVHGDIYTEEALRSAADEESNYIPVGAPHAEEWVLECMKEGKRVGISNMLVSGGVRACYVVAATPIVEILLFACPGCKRVSHNPQDHKHRYCGACNRFWTPDEIREAREALEEQHP